jgi:cystathionine beta-lyase
VSFDNTPNRQSTFAFKWEKYKGKDILPAWVADTEFTCAQPITDAIHKRVDHGVLGYTLPAQYEPAIKAIQSWCLSQYNWQIEANWIVWTPGVVPAFNMACKAFCKPGDAVMVQTPNYPPLLAAPKINDMQQVCIPSLLENERWVLDLQALEKHAARPECKLFIMCNPMNPMGSVLSKEELSRVADICNRHSVVLCSDEIHCDLILEDKPHIPASSIDAIADNSVTLMAASKTFNVAGLGTSFAIIPDPQVRAKFSKAGMGIVPWVTILGLVATEAAFTLCHDWHKQELAYLKANRDYLVDEINKIPGLHAQKPDATYLLWIDASGLGVNDTQAWCEAKGVGPSPGRDFGQKDFFRINYGCSREFLEQIVARLKA